MNRKMSLVFVGLFLVNAFGLAGFAQKNSPGELVLEITFLNGRPPAYQTISESAANSKWAWYSLFKRTPDFQIPAGGLPVRAVKFVPYFEKDSVKINVSVLTGQKFHDEEKVVGAYSARENERIVIKELKNFGVEPFEIAVVRVAPSASVLPSVINKTNSLQVIGVEPNFSTLPTYKLRLLNTSDKAISAFAFETLVNNQKRLSGMPQGTQGAALIEAGETFEKLIPNSLQNVKMPDGAVPTVQPNQTIVITMVVFADGSYEGEMFAAAGFRGFLVGRKTALKQIINILQPNTKPENLARQMSNLQITLDEADFAALLKEFSALSEKEKANLRVPVEVAVSGVKKDFLRQLEEAQNLK
ncbi:MAG: hypothetical protein LC768_09215, partial [Acidobacteria bacterium]|nr:hypothetical protein [Acidobacteriota bacterium]